MGTFPQPTGQGPGCQCSKSTDSGPARSLNHPLLKLSGRIPASIRQAGDWAIITVTIAITASIATIIIIIIIMILNDYDYIYLPGPRIPETPTEHPEGPNHHDGPPTCPRPLPPTPPPLPPSFQPSISLLFLSFSSR